MRKKIIIIITIWSVFALDSEKTNISFHQDAPALLKNPPPPLWWSRWIVICEYELWRERKVAEGGSTSFLSGERDKAVPQCEEFSNSTISFSRLFCLKWNTTQAKIELGCKKESSVWTNLSLKGNLTEFGRCWLLSERGKEPKISWIIL